MPDGLVEMVVESVRVHMLSSQHVVILKEKQGLADVLRQLRREGLSILLVEHDMDLVMGLVDRVVVMEFGTKLIEGTPEEVQASPAVRAAYLGTEH